MSAETTNSPYDAKKYDDFIKKWKNESKYESFFEDGPIDDDKWKNSPSRIMFLLRESYNDFDNVRNNKCLGALYMTKKQTAAKRFWRKMRLCTYIIDNKDKVIKNTISFPDAEELDKINDSIAYVNLKKRVEKGKTKSTFYNIRNNMVNDKLLKQIELINPRIILCSGTFPHCWDLYGRENLKETAHKRLYKMENIYFIDFWHLSYWRKSYEDIYKELIKIVKHIE